MMLARGLFGTRLKHLIPALGHSGVLTSVGGRGDDYVLVGMFSGHVFLWNGQSWHEQASPVSEAIGGFHQSPAGAFFARATSDVLRQTPTGWEKMDLAHFGSYFVITGLDFDSSGSPVVVTNKGKAIALNEQQSRLICETRNKLFGIVRFNDGFVIAGVPVGALYLSDGGELKEMRTTFAAYSVRKQGRVLLFGAANQSKGPSWAIHDPFRESDSQWYLLVLAEKSSWE